MEKTGNQTLFASNFTGEAAIPRNWLQWGSGFWKVGPSIHMQQHMNLTQFHCPVSIESSNFFHVPKRAPPEWHQKSERKSSSKITAWPIHQNQGIHHIYIFPRFLCDTASAISRLACPSTAKGRDGAAPTPTTTPSSLALILLIALCA